MEREDSIMEAQQGAEENGVGSVLDVEQEMQLLREIAHLQEWSLWDELVPGARRRLGLSNLPQGTMETYRFEILLRRAVRALPTWQEIPDRQPATKGGLKKGDNQNVTSAWTAADADSTVKDS
ncbi:unnamed protein product, partial [Discosporangium mesarthrocarpum]